VRRNDDTSEALEHRLDQFRQHTLPVARHYREKGLLKEVNATEGRDAVFRRLYADFHQEVEVAA
jgi:adenylate kinase family enzyme